jgi:hypothetical protein
MLQGKALWHFYWAIELRSAHRAIASQFSAPQLTQSIIRGTKGEKHRQQIPD